METSFVHTQFLVHLHVSKTNFHMKGFALGLVSKQRRKATRKSPIVPLFSFVRFSSSNRAAYAQLWCAEMHTHITLNWEQCTKWWSLKLPTKSLARIFELGLIANCKILSMTSWVCLTNDRHIYCRMQWVYVSTWRTYLVMLENTATVSLPPAGLLRCRLCDLVLLDSADWRCWAIISTKKSNTHFEKLDSTT